MTPRCAATSSPRSQAIDAARRRVTGAGFDGVLLIPSYFEAGRFTAGDIHWANVSGKPIPAGRHRIRPGRDVRLHLLQPAGLHRREERRHHHRATRCTASPWTTSGSAGPPGSPRSWTGSPAARSSWSTPPTTPTWRSSSSGSWRCRSRASRSATAAGRRSPVRLAGPGTTRTAYRGTDLARPATPAATAWSSSVRMLG